MTRAPLPPSARIALGFFASGMLAVLVALAMLRTEKAQFVASRQRYFSTVTELIVGSLRDFNDDRLYDLSLYAANERLNLDIKEALNGDAAGRRALEKDFAPLFHSGLYESVALVDRRGRIAWSAPAGAEPPRVSTGPAGAPRMLGIRRAADGRAMIDFETAMEANTRLLFRVRGGAWFQPEFENWPGAEKTVDLLVVQRSPGETLVLRKFGFAPNASPLVRAILASEEASGAAGRGPARMLSGIDDGGTRCYAVAQRIPKSNCILIAKIDQAEFHAPLRENSRLRLIAIGGLLTLLGAVILYYVRRETERVRAAAEAERLLLVTAIEQNGESVVITDANASIQYTNPAFTRATGYAREEVRGRNPSLLKSGRHDAAFYKAMWGKLTAGAIWEGRLVNRRKDGTLYEEDATITPVRDPSGAISHYIAVKRDVSTIRSLEEQLYHSQKMEAIGRLAGGIAHDFNNILTTINGYAEMLADAAPPDSPSAADLAEILGAGRRAALLTRQLLTFSRRAPIDPVVLDLRLQIRGIEKMLRRSLGEDIRLSCELPDAPVWVRTDPGQIDQVLMNLAVNARDAMPRGGTLNVRAGTAHFPADTARGHVLISAGRYATLAVADEGIGMNKEILARLFEPFFTTKEKGKGTGLGLATIFGIVKQNKGYITVESAPGAGSTFTVFLPLQEAAAAAPEAAAAVAPGSTRGDETILLAEDQEQVKRLVTRALIMQGYRVLSCDGGVEALAAARAVDGPIHLLLTDVVMPQMGGEELAARLTQLRPDMRVLYISGYTDGRLDGIDAARAKSDLLLKPFTPEQLCRRVRDALDGAAPRTA